ncbi:MAG: hypothetical protein JWP69_1857 [Flaviaesturariibacter sp.]|nr:hypothetical protein [Flaviaesturariibacter sp.]
MRNDNAQPYNEENRSRGDVSANNPTRDKMDLTDSKHDQERLQPEEVTIDLPDVKDIPGQEFVQVPPLGMLADTTISSADEEGEGLFEDDEEDETDIVMGTEADISSEEKDMLEKNDTYMPTRDEAYLQQASMDNTDFEGEALNEESFGDVLSGSDLDTGDMPDETRTDALGQGDEENKSYSLGSDENDNNENRS